MGHSDVGALVRASYENELGPIGAFLPARVPVNELPAALMHFIAACDELPSRYPREHGGVRCWLDREFRHETRRVHRAVSQLDAGQADALMTALSTLAHTYRWDTVPPHPARFGEQSISLPKGLAGPWSQVAQATDQPRVGSAWNLHLTNWQMTDRPGGASYQAEELKRSSIQIVRNWLEPPVDSQLENFSLSFVLMEAQGAKVLRALVEAISAAAAARTHQMSTALRRLHDAIRAMTLGFSSNVRSRTIDPTMWLELIQPTYAWAAPGEDPDRIEGGPSGMQLATIQALDAALDIRGESSLSQLARTARHHMPRPHRRFLAALDLAGPIVRSYVRDAGSPELVEQFNSCVAALGAFRGTHRARGSQYLRNRPSDNAARASTGLVIGVHDDPLVMFERSMTERIAETQAGTITTNPLPRRCASLSAFESSRCCLLVGSRCASPPELTSGVGKADGDRS